MRKKTAISLMIIYMKFLLLRSQKVLVLLPSWIAAILVPFLICRLLTILTAHKKHSAYSSKDKVAHVMASAATRGLSGIQEAMKTLELVERKERKAHRRAVREKSATVHYQ